jgi:hypothetical protein
MGPNRSEPCYWRTRRGGRGAGTWPVEGYPVGRRGSHGESFGGGCAYGELGDGVIRCTVAGPSNGQGQEHGMGMGTGMGASFHGAVCGTH